MAVKQMSKSKTASSVVDHLSPASASTANPLTVAEQLLVDKFAVLSAQVATFKPVLTEFDKLKKQISSIANDEDRYPETKSPVVLAGTMAVVEYSAAADAREISDINGLIGKLKAKLGYDGLLALLKVTLGDMDKYLSENEAAPFIKWVTGSRSMKSVHKK